MTQQAARPSSEQGLAIALGRSLWAAAVPVAAVLLWWLATKDKPNSLIPPPAEVGNALWDLAVGGINDDAFSNTLLTHLVASVSRVYGGFLLAAMIAACGLCIPPGNATARTPAHLSLAPSLARRAAWTGLAFVPSGLLVAVTAHLSTDVAAAPLLWVLPLALYLLSFVVTFRAGARIPGRTLGLALLPAVALLAVSPLLPPSILWLLPLHLGVLFVAANCPRS